METQLLSTLNQLDSAFVVNIGGSTHLKRRLLDLGFTKGTLVRIINISPLKNSFLLEIHGYILSIRSNAARCIQVVKADI